MRAFPLLLLTGVGLLLSSPFLPLAAPAADFSRTPYVAVTGSMGAGKTHFVNQMTGAGFMECNGGDSCTLSANAAMSSSRVNGQYVGFIDTVGFSSNHAENGFESSIIETVRAMEDKWVCGLVVMVGCLERPALNSSDWGRSVRAIEELTGLPPVFVHNDYDGSGKTCLDLRRHPLISGRTSQIKSAADVPGGMNCRPVKLPADFEARVRAHDFSSVRKQIDNYKEHECSAVSSEMVRASAQLAQSRTESALAHAARAVLETHDECPVVCLKKRPWYRFRGCRRYGMRDTCVHEFKEKTRKSLSKYEEDTAQLNARRQAADAAVRLAEGAVKALNERSVLCTKIAASPSGHREL